ncbi:MAG: Asp23/Gls24 family envelope stress response protein [Clostridiales Family XIII bacterium]|nr:Asp23/Gls24 family envelope stress response protein [Clostridiales Family XIII bacterium]
MDGRLIVSDPKGRLRKGAKAAAEDETGFARARLRAGVFDLKLFLIVRFGVSIRETAEELVSQLRKEFPEQTGVDVGLITIVFVGTLAEKLRRRNIMFVDDGTLHEVGEEEEI